MLEDVNIYTYHLFCFVVSCRKFEKTLVTCNVLLEPKRGNLLQNFQIEKAFGI